MGSIHECKHMAAAAFFFFFCICSHIYETISFVIVFGHFNPSSIEQIFTFWSHLFSLYLFWCSLIQLNFAGKILHGRSSYDSESLSFTAAASEKILVPGNQIDGASPTEQNDVVDEVLEDSEVCTLLLC